MRLWRCVHIVLLAASSAGASTLDVGVDASVLVRTGDALVFRLLTSNFGVNAARLGVSQSPSQVDFALVSDGAAVGGEFAATLESADRSVSVGFGDLTFHPGIFQGSSYAGEAAMLEGDLPLSRPISGTLFAGPFVMLYLRNEGPDIRIGLAPYLLRQDLFASLSSGPLSVGAVPYTVDLEGRAERSIALARAAGAAATEVPEPATRGLLLGGGVLLGAFLRLRSGRFRRPAIQG